MGPLFRSQASEKGLSMLMTFFERKNERLKTVKFDLVEKSQKFSNLSFGESRFLKPDDVGFRQVNEESALVFSKGHGGVSEFDQFILLGVHGQMMTLKSGFVR